MKTFLLSVLLVSVSFLVGLGARQLHISQAWEVHRITGVSLYQVVTGRKLN